MAHIFRFPRPRAFLHVVSLRTATEFITFTLAINKVTGLYGILALFTGYSLNPLQLSHYLYSLLVLGLIVYLHPAIRQRDQVLKNVGLAWLYALDTVINNAYTALFGAGWFVLLAQHLDEPIPIGGDGTPAVPGQGTIDDTAGFTSPAHNVSKVDVIAAPAADALFGQAAVAYPTAGGSLGSAVFQSGSVASLTVLVLLWLIRIYFCVIVLAHARSVLRQHVASTSASHYGGPSGDPTIAENPFRVGREEGTGWRGKLGRFMLCCPTPRYWLGKDDGDEEWARVTAGRFEAGKDLKIKVPVGTGLGERERRARSGTGPPPAPKGKAAA